MAAEALCLPDAVSRLSIARPHPYLAAHHGLAADRLMRLFARANLRQRVTMSYDPTRIGRQGGAGQGDLADSAADARKTLNRLANDLPADCWAVLVDVCLFDRGLQDIEQARGWPRRAAKLVLRIGLDQIASRFGLDAGAAGKSVGELRNWLPERVPMS